MVVRTDALETFQAANGKLELCICKGKRMLVVTVSCLKKKKKKERKGTLTVT